MPASIVNDNGKPNLNNSIADNDNDGRVLVRISKYALLNCAFAPAAYLASGFGKLSLHF